MTVLLYVIGAIVFIISIIIGISSDSSIGGLIGIVGGISSAIIYFALGICLENQYAILSKLEEQKLIVKAPSKYGKIRCSKCDYSYDSERNSCPRCGYRE